MRKLSELIVLVRGGGEVGSAVANILTKCHFRVCIAETANPLCLRRSLCYSEAVFETEKFLDGITAEKTSVSLESIYKSWRNERIPVVVDPDLIVKPLLKPDVLINALMLGKRTSTRIEDAPLVIGIGPGFVVGNDVHLVIDTEKGENLGKVYIEGEIETSNEEPDDLVNQVLKAEDNGVFTTEKNIGDFVSKGDVIGMLNDIDVVSPTDGVIRGLLHNETKVLNNTDMAEIDPVNEKIETDNISRDMRLIGGGVLEAILMSLNIGDNLQH